MIPHDHEQADKAVKGAFYVRHPNGVVSFLMTQDRAWDYAQLCGGMAFHKINDNFGTMITSRGDKVTLPEKLKSSKWHHILYAAFIFGWFIVLDLLVTYGSIHQ